jgi:hypothetical protein
VSRPGLLGRIRTRVAASGIDREGHAGALAEARDECVEVFRRDWAIAL